MYQHVHHYHLHSHPYWHLFQHWLLVGLLVTPLVIWIVADLTRLSFPCCSSCTIARCHFSLWLLLWIITTSPTFILSFSVPVLVVWVSRKDFKYSLFQWPQNVTWLELMPVFLLRVWCSFWPVSWKFSCQLLFISQGMLMVLPYSRWDDIRGSGSSWSMLTYVNGLLFRWVLISIINVCGWWTHNRVSAPFVNQQVFPSNLHTSSTGYESPFYSLIT